MARKGEKFDKEGTIIEIITNEKKEKSILGSIFGIVIGIVGLKIGGDLVVNGSVEMARVIGITEKLISLTIVAFSTSLPELITSITATKKGNTDMAIGNVLGSQIFNIFLILFDRRFRVLGIPALQRCRLAGHRTAAARAKLYAVF